ncbi:hypothetical protein [Streptomyces sp. NPDC008001]|uniref:hypothetical protein n=1 Tax=Streptomyces sp. NPDC008001 TaxID=3364804 RepID=UPI0036F10442
MRLTTIDAYEPRPGRVVEFVPAGGARAAAAAAPPSPVPPSFNQRFHLAGSVGNWLGCAFDLPAGGPVGTGRLREVFEGWVRRHGTLRSGFRAGGERFLVPVEAVGLRVVAAGDFTDAGELRRWLAGRLEAGCGRWGWPSYVLCAVLRDDGATVVCGFDHAHVDACSLAVVVHELREGYAGRALRGGGGPAGGPGPRVTGSFVDYCALEQANAAAAPPPDRSDPRLRGWASFFAACGGTTPSFPLELGGAAPQGTDVRQLLDAEGAARWEERCRSGGGSAFSGLLTAFGLAARRSGAGEVLRMCVPLHTRDEERWERAVGWFTTVAPVTVGVRGVRSAAEGAGRTREDFRRAVRVAALPAARALEALSASGEFRRTKDDVFMVSYVDYRRLPGSAAHAACRAHHISGVTVADDAQFWLSRTHEGLFLRSRWPGTAAGGAVVTGFADAVEAEVAAGAGAPAAPAKGPPPEITGADVRIHSPGDVRG